MAHSIGGIPLRIRLRIEAGIGDTLTDVGHADIDTVLPVTIEPTDGPGASINVDTAGLTAMLTHAVAAFEHAVPIGTHNHQPIQHRDGKPPWCPTCGLTAEGTEPVSRLG